MGLQREIGQNVFYRFKVMLFRYDSKKGGIESMYMSPKICIFDSFPNLHSNYMSKNLKEISHEPIIHKIFSKIYGFNKNFHLLQVDRIYKTWFWSGVTNGRY